MDDSPLALALAYVAWRFWLGALNNKGGRGQRNREEIGREQLGLFSSRLRRSVVLPTKPPRYAGYTRAPNEPLTQAFLGSSHFLPHHRPEHSH